ncbi:uncharacterized protein A4U43_C07F14050 [Asparagus officinalis]|uniref:Uncharacterized protein n=1 Tax=Asparagus officinalis TaxID=4686 RepID=A0A5P1EF60_ASPOF|nr:uncharacterized protein A4U43_C07F14050 [Asparagus officinalis]
MEEEINRSRSLWLGLVSIREHGKAHWAKYYYSFSSLSSRTHWSDASYPQLIFFNANSNSADSTTSGGCTIAISPNANLTFNISYLITSSPPSSPPPLLLARYGVIGENETMRMDFDVGEFDSDLEDNDNGDDGSGGGSNETSEERGGVPGLGLGLGSLGFVTRG